MRRPVVYASLILVAVVGLLWILIPSTPAESASDLPAREAKRTARSFDDSESESGLEAPSARPKRPLEEAEHRAVEKLDPNSPEFADHVDNALPNHLYDVAAQKCYRPGLDRNELISFNYRIRAKGGAMSIHDLKITEQRIKDPGLAECFAEAIKSATWQDEQMPDWEDEDDLYIAMRGLKKHLGDDSPDDPDDHLARPVDQPKIEDEGEGNGETP